jgi:hypothetical protein
MSRLRRPGDTEANRYANARGDRDAWNGESGNGQTHYSASWDGRCSALSKIGRQVGRQHVLCQQKCLRRAQPVNGSFIS